MSLSPVSAETYRLDSINCVRNADLSDQYPDLNDAVANKLRACIVGAIKDGVDSSNLPKFIADPVRANLNNWQSQNCKPVDPPCCQAVDDRSGDAFSKFQNELLSEIKDCFGRYKSDENKKCGNDNGTDPTPGKGSWITRLFTALGQLLNAQQDKVDKLQKQVSDSLGAGDGSPGSQKAQFDLMEQFKAEAQIMTVLMQTVQQIENAIADTAKKSSEQLRA